MADTPNITAVPTPRLRRGLRLFLFYSSAVLMTGAVSLLFADLLWRTGWSTSRTVLLVLFIILFLLTAIGCMHGLYGFVIRIIGTRCRITALGSDPAACAGPFRNRVSALRSDRRSTRKPKCVAKINLGGAQQ